MKERTLLIWNLEHVSAVALLSPASSPLPILRRSPLLLSDLLPTQGTLFPGLETFWSTSSHLDHCPNSSLSFGYSQPEMHYPHHDLEITNRATWLSLNFSSDALEPLLPFCCRKLIFLALELTYPNSHNSLSIWELVQFKGSIGKELKYLFSLLIGPSFWLP